MTISVSSWLVGIKKNTHRDIDSYNWSGKSFSSTNLQ